MVYFLVFDNKNIIKNNNKWIKYVKNTTQNLNKFSEIKKFNEKITHTHSFVYTK